MARELADEDPILLARAIPISLRDRLPLYAAQAYLEGQRRSLEAENAT